MLLPQFSLPGEERFPMRDLPFVHRFYRPENPDGSTIVLLHGTGGNEADLMPIAHRIAPRATLLGVLGRDRGRDPTLVPPLRFPDLRSERSPQRSPAFAAFVEGAVNGYGLSPDKLTFLGYSNGANLLAAVIHFHPGTVRRAMLLRSLQALENPPTVDLADWRCPC